MRLLTIFILLSAIVNAAFPTRADEAFAKITVDGYRGNIVSQKSAAALHKAPFEFAQYATGFWTPTRAEVLQADRASRKWVGVAAITPERTFPLIAQHPDGFAVPTLETLKKNAIFIAQHFKDYERQFVGLIIYDGRKRSYSIYCNYFLPDLTDSCTPKAVIEESDPSRHFIEADDGGAGYWQTTYDLASGKCTSLGINSSP